MPPRARKGKAAAAAAAEAMAPAPAPEMESNKENVAEGAAAAVPASPPVRVAGKGLKSARNWEEELGVLTQKLNKMKLEKEEVQRLVQEQEMKIKEQHERITLQMKEQEKLQKKIKKLEEIQPNLDVPSPNDSCEDSKGKKKKIDPDRVKRPSSAYILWCNDQRDKLRAENPNANFKEMNGILSELWKTVTDEEKKPYEEIYQRNKEEYKEKKEAETEAQPKPKKKEKDPEKPKRPTTGYMAYSEERRPALMSENLKVPQIGKILGEEWRSMDEEARAPYEKIAAEAKATYATEMEAYNKKAQERDAAEPKEKPKPKGKEDEPKAAKPEPEKEKAPRRSRAKAPEPAAEPEKEKPSRKAKAKAPEPAAEPEKEKAPRKAKAKAPEPGKPKRSPSAYILFGMEYRKKLQAEMPSPKFAELTALVAAKWNEMSAEEKQPYVDQAGVEKGKYQEAMEEFKKIGPNDEDDRKGSSGRFRS